MQKFIINGIQTYAPTSKKEIIDYALERKSGILVAVNAEKIMNSTSEFKELINKNIGYPDGIGAVWALRKKGLKQTIKIPGCELWLNIIEQTYKDKTFILIGGTEEVIKKTTEQLRTDFEGINILYHRNGFIKSDQDKSELKNKIENLKPDFVFVAMGSPKQELLMQELQSYHGAIYQGLGGSFDVYTGTVERAPKWWVKNNLEWAYRLYKQPSRLKRQLPLIKFFINLQLNKF